MQPEQIEKVYKAGWHAMIAGVGVYEYRVHKTRFSKFLSVCLIAFHADAAVCDYLDIPTTPQRWLKNLLDKRA
jgi:hypothetical protein